MISKQDTEKVAKLARLGISDKEAGEFQKELSSVLNYFKMIDSADVSKSEPTFHSAEDFLNKSDILREDRAEAGSENVSQKIIDLSPDKKGRYLKVKAIL